MAAPIDDLVAIAAGTKARVAGWSKLLRAESIQYVIATSCCVDEDEPDHAELWVHNDDAEKAKKVLRASSRGGGQCLW
jgi:hypothetical protein